MSLTLYVDLTVKLLMDLEILLTHKKFFNEYDHDQSQPGYSLLFQIFLLQRLEKKCFT